MNNARRLVLFALLFTGAVSADEQSARQWIDRSASPMVADSTASSPLGAAPQPDGTSAVVKPNRAASASRRSMPVTRRRSPARPTSPITTIVAGRG